MTPTPTPRSDDATGHPVLQATPARQGRYGRHMFWVLVAGTLLAAIGLALAWGWKAPSLSRADSQLSAERAQAAASTNTPAVPARQTP